MQALQASQPRGIPLGGMPVMLTMASPQTLQIRCRVKGSDQEAQRAKQARWGVRGGGIMPEWIAVQS